MRNFLHYLFSILLWILFGYYWYVVFERQITGRTLYPLGILFGLSAVGLAATLWWVAHNKRIARRGRRRNLMPAPSEPFEQDNLARPIVAPPVTELKTAREVTISLDDEGNKVYTPVYGEGA